MGSQASLEILLRLDLGLLGLRRATSGRGTGGRVAGGGAAFSLLLVELLKDALLVGLHDIFGDAFHAEDLEVEALAVGQRILNLGESLFVDLRHVDVETYNASVQSAIGTVWAHLQRCSGGDRISRT